MKSTLLAAHFMLLMISQRYCCVGFTGTRWANGKHNVVLLGSSGHSLLVGGPAFRVIGASVVRDDDRWVMF